MEVILYSNECNWYTRCCLLNGGVRYRECPLMEAILYCTILYIIHLLMPHSYAIVLYCAMQWLQFYEIECVWLWL